MNGYFFNELLIKRNNSVDRMFTQRHAAVFPSGGAHLMHEALIKMSKQVCLAG